MTTALDLAGPTAAFMAGLVTSLHCVGMCAPLACSACTSACGRGNESAAAATYHGTRLLAYITVGFVAGWFGERASAVLLGGATRGMTWVFVLFFLAVVAGLDKRLRLPAPGVWFARFSDNNAAGPCSRAAVLGACTPLLPCAPLYLVVAAAALSGSPASGAMLMGAFGIGTVPLLFLVQNRLGAIGKRFSPKTLDLTRRGLALASVILLLMRGTYSISTGCPMCH